MGVVTCTCRKGAWHPDCVVHPPTVLPFRKPDQPDQNVQVTASGPIDISTCSGIVHVFDQPGGTCKCGQSTWRDLVG